MNFQRSGRGEKRWLPDTTIAFLVSFAFLLFNTTSAGSVEFDFFGADKNKIRETHVYACTCICLPNASTMSLHASDNLDCLSKDESQTLFESVLYHGLLDKSLAKSILKETSEHTLQQSLSKSFKDTTHYVLRSKNLLFDGRQQVLWVSLHFPKYLKICHKSDRKLDECIKSSLEKFMENVSSGFEALNLPNLDPIELPLLVFQLGSGNVILRITFKDFRIDGFKHFRVTNVKSNLIDSKFEISVENPVVIMTAQYLAEGGVYSFPISGEGDFFLKLTDVTAVLIFRLATTNILPGLSFFTVENCLIDLLSSEIKAHFGEYIDGNNAIGAAFNTFFNNNAHEIFTLIKPKLSETLANIFGSIANEILSRHPEDVLLPE